MGQQNSFDLTPLLQAAADDLTTTVTGELRWALAGPTELAGLTDSDRELVQVVTGECIPHLVTGEIAVSFFALQIAVDRLVGPLRGGEDVPITYVEDVYTSYEGSPAGTPICGELLDLALAYLAGRELALLGPDLS